MDITEALTQVFWNGGAASEEINDLAATVPKNHAGPHKGSETCQE
jgi:hypothetical protein